MNSRSSLVSLGSEVNQAWLGAPSVTMLQGVPPGSAVCTVQPMLPPSTSSHSRVSIGRSSKLNVVVVPPAATTPAWVEAAWSGARAVTS